MQPLDLSPSSRVALLRITAEDALYQSDLPEQLAVSSWTASNCARSLADAGLITRHETTDDGQQTYRLEPAEGLTEADLPAVTPAEARALACLYHHGGLPQSELSDALDVSSHRRSTLARRIAEKGLIDRIETTHGGASTYLLTPVELDEFLPPEAIPNQVGSPAAHPADAASKTDTETGTATATTTDVASASTPDQPAEPAPAPPRDGEPDASVESQPRAGADSSEVTAATLRPDGVHLTDVFGGDADGRDAGADDAAVEPEIEGNADTDADAGHTDPAAASASEGTADTTGSTAAAAQARSGLASTDDASSEPTPAGPADQPADTTSPPAPSSPPADEAEPPTTPTTASASVSTAPETASPEEDEAEVSARASPAGASAAAEPAGDTAPRAELSPTAARALDLIRARGDLPLRDLARGLDLDPADCQDTVRALVDAELVEREQTTLYGRSATMLSAT